MDVVVPELMDTAYVEDTSAATFKCALDYAEGKVHSAHKNEVVELFWSTWKSPSRQTTNFVYNLKAWVTPLGKRKLTLRVRRIRDDGKLGMSILIWKRVDRKIIK